MFGIYVLGDSLKRTYPRFGTWSFIVTYLIAFGLGFAIGHGRSMDSFLSGIALALAFASLIMLFAAIVGLVFKD